MLKPKIKTKVVSNPQGIATLALLSVLLPVILGFTPSRSLLAALQVEAYP